jgi:hypothetical protein
MSSRKAGDRCAALAIVGARVTAVRGSATRRLISGIGRGVVVLARALAQPQAELQHVEGCVRVAPLGQLVAPGGVELRPAQLLGILRREGVSRRAVGPFEAAARRGPCRALRPRGDAQQAGGALDHHHAHVVLGLADQSNAEVALRCVRRRAGSERAHPFGAGARLAGAAPAEHQPAGPRAAVGGGRLLVRVRERGEVMRQAPPLIERRHLRQHRAAQSGLRRTRQCGAQVRYGSHRCRRGDRHLAVRVAAWRIAAVAVCARLR